MKNIRRTFLLTLTCVFMFSIVVFGQNEEAQLEIAHLEGDFYIYTTYNTYQGVKYPANGIYLLTDEGALMIDTPWDPHNSNLYWIAYYTNTIKTWLWL